MQRAGRPGLSAARALGDRRAVPDPRWIARLTGRSAEEVGRWLGEMDRYTEMEGRIRRTHRDGGRSSYAQFRAPLELYALVRALQPELVVEAGVSSGVSSAHFLLALRANGHGRLVSIDLPTRQRGPRLAPDESPVALPPGRPTGWAVPPELHDGWELRLGPSQRELPKVARQGEPIGIFLHDDLHTPSHLTWELRTVEPFLVPGAVVLADNTAWTGAAFPRFAARHGVPYVRRRGSDLVGLRMPAPRKE